MRFGRLAILATTLIAWALPSALAMWLDVERFVHPYTGAEGYEKEPRFQSVFFLFRFGWLLALVLAVILVVQVGVLRRIDAKRPTPMDAA